MVSHLDTTAAVRLHENKLELERVARMHRLTVGNEATPTAGRRPRVRAWAMVAAAALTARVVRRDPGSQPVS